MILSRLDTSREKWFAERLSIETMSRDAGDVTIFMTINFDPRSDFGCRSLLFKLENGTEMPADHPYEMDTQRFTELVEKYSCQLSIYLYMKTKLFLKAFLCDICGIPEKEVDDDWTKVDRISSGWYFSRVEHNETRGLQVSELCVCALLL